MSDGRVVEDDNRTKKEMIKSLSVMISSIMKDVIVTLAVVVVVVYQTVEYHVNYLPNHFVDRYTGYIKT